MCPASRLKFWLFHHRRKVVEIKAVNLKVGTVSTIGFCDRFNPKNSSAWLFPD